MEHEHRGHILVLEDDEGVAALERRRLERAGYLVQVVADADAAREQLALRKFDLVVLDYQLGQAGSGLDLYTQLREAGHQLPAVLVTGRTDEAVLIEAIRSGVHDFVPKRTDYLDILVNTINRVMDRVRNERQAALAAALAKADEHKNAFLAQLAHELRNPLGPVLSAAQVLRLSQASGQTPTEMIDVIERQVKLMSRLIDDLMDVSRISRGKILLRNERFDLRELIAGLIEDYRQRFEEARIELVADLPNRPALVHGDPTRIAQAIGNLLGNAQKFTPTGGRVTATLAVAGNPARAQFTLRDTGVGMDRESLQRVFEAFVQAEHTLEQSRGGLGLGLALVKGLVELHGGDVRAESAGIGLGSEFRVTLPLAPGGASAASPEPIEGNGANCRVLVIEDNPDAARSLQMLLAHDGHIVRVAHEGDEALAVAAEFHPQVVFCDIGLPGQLDGFEVARRLRAMPQLDPCYLVALTGHAHETAQQRTREAGFDLHVVKPIDMQAMRKILTQAADCRDNKSANLA